LFVYEGAIQPPTLWLILLGQGCGALFVRSKWSKGHSLEFSAVFPNMATFLTEFLEVL